MAKEAKQDTARDLYVKGYFDQNEIAEFIGVNSKTVSRWKAAGKWDDLKKTLSTTKAEQLKKYYNIQGKLLDEGEEFLNDDNPKTNPNYDALSKVGKIIERLEKRSGPGEVIQSVMLLMKYLKVENLALAKQMNPYAMTFIQELIAKQTK